MKRTRESTFAWTWLEQCFHTDRFQEFCVHQGNPIKEFSGGCKVESPGCGVMKPGLEG